MLTKSMNPKTDYIGEFIFKKEVLSGFKVYRHFKSGLVRTYSVKLTEGELHFIRQVYDSAESYGVTKIRNRFKKLMRIN